jgi:hypothetical protein
MLEGQLDRFVMLDDETHEMYNRMKLMVNKTRAYGSKKWTNKIIAQRLLRAYTIRDTALVSIIISGPNLKRMTPKDILARIINHELILEEARYVKNLSKGIVSTKKDVIALKDSKKSKKKQIQVESSSEEDQDEDEEDEKEYDKGEMTLFIKKFNKYISKRRHFKGDKKEKTRSKWVCYNCSKNGLFISQCPYERKDEDNDKKKKKDKRYKKDKKFTKKKSYGQAHVGQE